MIDCPTVVDIWRNIMGNISERRRQKCYARGLQHLLAQGPHFNGRKIRGPHLRFTKQSLHIIAGHAQ
jgi:hypothetical protein